MAMSMMIDTDTERRAARRQELKRKLAETEVKKTRLAELQTIIGKINADSDAAAAEHSEAAGALQAELDGLDAQHVDAILAGEKTPDKALKRRGEILNELAKLNQTLEVRCESNRRSVTPLERQRELLSREIAKTATLKNDLAALCDDATRRGRKLVEHRLQVAQAGLRDCQRSVAIFQHNQEVCTLNKRNGFSVADEIAIADRHLADWLWMRERYEQQIRELHDEDRHLAARALAE